jgi:hypothetical protein
MAWQGIKVSKPRVMRLVLRAAALLSAPHSQALTAQQSRVLMPSLMPSSKLNLQPERASHHLHNRVTTAVTSLHAKGAVVHTVSITAGATAVMPSLNRWCSSASRASTVMVLRSMLVSLSREGLTQPDVSPRFALTENPVTAAVSAAA